MNVAMLMLVASTLTAPQAPSNYTSGAPNLRVMGKATFVTDADGLPVQAPKGPSHQMAGKAVTIAIQGGLFFNAGTGFFVGAGISAQPGGNENVEIMGDVNFGHGSSGGQGFTVFYISFNGLYDFTSTDSGLIPFVGGGIGIAHTSVLGFGSTSTGLQLIGGIQLAGHSDHPMRLSIRFLFVTGTPIFVVFGYGF